MPEADLPGFLALAAGHGCTAVELRTAPGQPVHTGLKAVERARKDYGVVLELVDADLAEYAVDKAATERVRAAIRAERRQWAATNPVDVSDMYKAGRIDGLDAVRQYAVILDWDNGDLLPETTRQFREMHEKRTIAHWK